MIFLYTLNRLSFIIKLICIFLVLNTIVVIATAQIAVWDATGASGFGTSPYSATTLHANVTSQGLKRGSGVGASGNAAAGGWGGNAWASTANEAISGNKTIEFTVAAANGYKLSLSTLNLHYRRSQTGPGNALLQYAVDNGTYTTITILSFSSTSSSGDDISPVSLIGIAALQNVEVKPISFRLVPYGATGSTGTWYVYKSNLSLDGNVELAATAGPTNCQTITYSNSSNLSITGMGSNDAAGTDNVTEINAFAWTCNANNQPICNVRTLFKLDVSNIPVGTPIISAKLKLFAKTDYPYAMPGKPTYGTANAGLLQKVMASWQPAVGWPNQPAVDQTNQVTLPGSSNTAQNYEVDITDFVQSWINKPDSNFGMLFRIKVEQYYNSLIFHAGSNSSPEYLKPQLYVCFNTNTTTPLHLLSFNGNLSGNTANLVWDTENELEMDYFELQKSTNGIDYITITNINAHNISGTNKYSYADMNVSGTKVYYRLKMLDKSGRITYSRIVPFSLSIINTRFSFTLQPNPAHSNVQLQISSQNDKQIFITLTDVIGKKMLVKSINVKKGINNINVPGIEHVSKGIYFITLQSASEMQSQRLIID